MWFFTDSYNQCVRLGGVVNTESASRSLFSSLLNTGATGLFM